LCPALPKAFRARRASLRSSLRKEPTGPLAELAWDGRGRFASPLKRLFSFLGFGGKEVTLRDETVSGTFSREVRRSQALWRGLASLLRRSYPPALLRGGPRTGSPRHHLGGRGRRTEKPDEQNFCVIFDSWGTYGRPGSSFHVQRQSPCGCPRRIGQARGDCPYGTTAVFAALWAFAGLVLLVKRSQTWAGWGIWGVAHHKPYCAKQSQLAGRRTGG